MRISHALSCGVYEAQATTTDEPGGKVDRPLLMSQGQCHVFRCQGSVVAVTYRTAYRREKHTAASQQRVGRISLVAGALERATGNLRRD